MIQKGQHAVGLEVVKRKGFKVWSRENVFRDFHAELFTLVTEECEVSFLSGNILAVKEAEPEFLLAE